MQQPEPEQVGEYGPRGINPRNATPARMNYKGAVRAPLLLSTPMRQICRLVSLVRCHLVTTTVGRSH
jgi:hypothetical protein